MCEHKAWRRLAYRKAWAACLVAAHSPLLPAKLATHRLHLPPLRVNRPILAKVEATEAERCKQASGPTSASSRSFLPTAAAHSQREGRDEPTLGEAYQGLCPQTTCDDDSHFTDEETEDPGSGLQIAYHNLWPQLSGRHEETEVQDH